MLVAVRRMLLADTEPAEHVQRPCSEALPSEDAGRSMLLV
jgi:hypothetical protein